jgi:hypothetical protein
MFQPLVPKTAAEPTAPGLPELFKMQLKTARSLDQIKNIIKRLGLNPTHDPFYSELAFGHILTTNCGLANDFLIDPSLNPPVTSNYRKIVEHLKEHVADKETRKTLLGALFNGFSAGLVRREEAQAILQSLPDIIIDSKDGPLTARKTPKINKYYSVILRRLAECSVFSTRDLGRDTIKAWIGYANEMPCDRYAAELILSLTKSAAILQAMERFERGSRAFEVFLSHVEATTTSDLTTRWLKGLCECPARRERDLGHFARFLSHRPPALLGSVVIGMPTRLVVSIQNNRLSAEAFPIWAQVLYLIDQKTVTPVLKKRSIWKRKMSEIDGNLSEDAQLVLKSWTALILCNQTEEPLRNFQQMDFPSQLRDQFQAYDPALLWKHIRRALQPLPKLPFRGQLFDFLNKVQNPVAMADVIRTTERQAVLDDFVANGFAVLQDDQAYLRALRDLNDPLKNLAESINQDIPGFARIILPLVARDRLSLRIVTRLLKHNEKFHFALMNSWPPLSRKDANVTVPNEQSRGVSRLTELATRLTMNGDSVFQKAVLKFMHDLAIAFAVSPALSNRQALRKVFWCFSFLHRYGAPIHPPITKALWYAGVTRCEGKGTARKVVLWLLRKIQEVEGPVIAEGLVTNTDLRAKRAVEIWRRGRRLGEGLVRDEDKPRRLRGFESEAGWVCRLHASAPKSRVAK